MRLILFAPIAAAAACAASPHYATLPPQQVTDLRVEAVGAPQFCPVGPSVQLRAGVHLNDGRTLATWSYGNGAPTNREGQLDFASFTWRADVGAIAADGQYHPPDDPFATLDRIVTVDAGVPGRSDLRASIALTPRYDCPYDFGADGGDGGGGASGLNGSNGSDGSDGDHPGDGGNGGDGEDGGDGGAGQSGGSVDVALAYLDGAQGRHVLARVRDASGTSYAILDPGGPALSIHARGGRGGDGGSGGSGGGGGSGGHAGDRTTYGSDGSRGSDGRSGRGGNGGDGGEVRVSFDHRHPELQSLVSVDTRGGDGGNGSPGGTGGRSGPPPAFEPADASVLFGAELARGIPVER